MLLPRKDDASNIFQKDALYVQQPHNHKVIYYLQQIISNMKIEKRGKNITLNDLCFKPISGKGCLTPSPMDIWLQDPILLE